MDKNFTLRIRILGIIATVVLALYFLKGIAIGVTAFADGFKAGYSSAEMETQSTEAKSTAKTITPKEIFGEIILKPVESITSSEQNPAKISVGNVDMLLRVVDMEVGDVPSQPVAISIVKAILLMAYMVLIVWMLVKIWSIIGLITKGDLLKQRIIASLKSIGFLLISIEIISICYSYMEVAYLKTFVKVPGYEIGLDYSLTTLLLGLILLLFAEILSYSIKMKEEQELTI